MARLVVAVVVASAWLVSAGPRAHADAPPDFLLVARQAIGDAQALADVHSLHVTLTRQNAADRAREDSRGVSTTKMQVWLEPPFRMLQSALGGGLRSLVVQNGIDGTRVFAHGVVPEAAARRRERDALRRYALAWLLFDPDQLGVTVTDAGSAEVEHQIVRVLRATDETGFDLRLYFDPLSHRLVMTDEVTMIRASNPGHGHAASAASIETRTLERFTYGAYRRVHDIDLPFSMTQQLDGTIVNVWHVTGYDLNPATLDAAFKE